MTVLRSDMVRLANSRLYYVEGTQAVPRQYL